MKYYAASDVHGYGTVLESALRAAGFFDDGEANMLILNGGR